jgi:phosphatidylinositol alpha-mannosyltransferase
MHYYNPVKRREARMKIGVVSPYDWSYPGGVREHIRHLASQFTSMGHEVRVLAPATRATHTLLDEHTFYGMGKTAPVPINGSIARIAIDPTLAWRVRNVLKQENFDILHIHEPLVPGLSLTALRFSNTLTVGTFHAFAHPKVASTQYLAYASATPFLRPYFRRLAGRIAVSSAAQQFASHYFPADYRIIPNGVDLERFNPNVLPLPQLMDGKQNILFVGRFERRKGAKFLIRAIPRIREQHPNTRFIFVGEGRLRPGIQRVVQQHGWKDVIFTGYITDSELPRYFSSAHVFCAPATGGESMGIVLLESMASGTPVVASNIPGYATVVRPGIDGLLSAPRNSEELAQAISTLLKSENLRQKFIHTGLQQVHAYAWPYVARTILDYYESLLDEQKTRTKSSQLLYKRVWSE